MKRTGEFLVCLLFNMFITFEWTIPAWILLAVHFFFDWSILWFWIAVGAWLMGVILWMCIIGWATRCSKPDKPKENKNPYSVKSNN